MEQDAGGGTEVGGCTVELRPAGAGEDRDQGGDERPELSEEQILAWADAYHEATGEWPVEESGAVAEAPGESWREIKQTLARGGRGLPGGWTLAELLAERRNVPLP